MANREGGLISRRLFLSPEKTLDRHMFTYPRYKLTAWILEEEWGAQQSREGLRGEAEASCYAAAVIAPGVCELHRHNRPRT